jgi:hypothetical protein
MGIVINYTGCFPERIPGDTSRHLVPLVKYTTTPFNRMELEGRLKKHHHDRGIVHIGVTRTCVRDTRHTELQSTPP